MPEFTKLLEERSTYRFEMHSEEKFGLNRQMSLSAIIRLPQVRLCDAARLGLRFTRKFLSCKRCRRV